MRQETTNTSTSKNYVSNYVIFVEDTLSPLLKVIRFPAKISPI
jgi:hypothetical protein